jgi:hypothetical protein
MKTSYYALLTALLTTVAAPLFPVLAATTTFTVSDVNDDAYGLTSTGDSWTDDKVVCGYASGYSSPYIIGAFRFNTITIPPGATITHAYLRVQAYLTGTGSSSLTIKGEAYDSTTSYADFPYIGQRVVTSAQVAWSVTSAWVEDGVYTSPDIKTVVQEIVNRAGWACNNALAIQLRNAAASGGYQMIYSLEGANYYVKSPAQLIVEYTSSTTCSGPVLVSENYIPGATNTPSSVPTYLNDPDMYCPSASGGLCWATANGDILAYWDRNPYLGVRYWNLVDNGTAPLLQPALPTASGHDEANVLGVVGNLANKYYVQGRTDEKAMIEELANQTNGLTFTVTYHGPVSSTADRTTLFGIIKGEIDSGRPISIGSWGTYFGGPHQIPVIGYKEMSPAVNSMVYIHLNTGGTQNEYDSIYASSWDDLDMDQIVPGGTPVDEYEAGGDNTSATTVSLNPDDIYGFRQTHNFSTAGDVDWVSLSTVAGRQYVIETKSLGASCDTVLSLYRSDGVTQIAQDDDSGGEARASKMLFRCWTTGTHFIKMADKVNGYGPAANYDLQASYSTISNAPPTLDTIANLTISEDAAPTNISLTGIGTSPDSEQMVTNITATSDNTGLMPNPTVIYTPGNTTGTLSFAPVANSNGGPVTITVVVNDNGGTANGGVDSKTNTFQVTVNAVNDAPSFIKGANQSAAQNAGVQTVDNWATAISPGPLDESSQTMNFIVTNNNNGLFSTQPAVSASGTLTYTPAVDATGVATTSVRLHDNGGAANGGVDTSAEQVFTIAVGSTPPGWILSLAISNGTATLTWGAVSGQTYRVLYIGGTGNTGWSALLPDVVASGPTASKTDQPLVNLRFYKVRQVLTP